MNLPVSLNLVPWWALIWIAAPAKLRSSMILLTARIGTLWDLNGVFMTRKSHSKNLNPTKRIYNFLSTQWMRIMPLQRRENLLKCFSKLKNSQGLVFSCKGLFRMGRLPNFLRDYFLNLCLLKLEMLYLEDLPERIPLNVRWTVLENHAKRAKRWIVSRALILQLVGIEIGSARKREKAKTKSRSMWG